jgi:predicted RNA binding protein YcfA (HicA-like mRNA interferase family)
MSRLPAISGQEAVTAFEKAGWVRVRVGSTRHIIMKKEGSAATLSVPDHKTLDRGLLRSLIRDAFLTVDDFCDLLK